LLESIKGDYLLSPMYDLLNTKMHVDDSDFALNKGLFADNYKSERYEKSDYPNKNDFEEFGRRIGVSENRIEKLMTPYLKKQPFVEVFIGRSFLTDVNKRGYLMMYQTKRNYLMEE
jgi:serine/threonine-protein kinase HipA